MEKSADNSGMFVQPKSLTKNMLHVITLDTINCIFGQCKIKIGARAQALYMNCLIHHFKNKPANITEATAFEMKEGELGSGNYDYQLAELHEAGLVQVNKPMIIFNNMWGQFIDRSQLEPAPIGYTGRYNMHRIEKFEQDLQADDQLFNLIMRKYTLSKSEAEKLLSLFIAEQKTVEKTYTDINDCKGHFSKWSGYNLNLIGKKNNGVAPTKVVSDAKMLGK